MTLMPTWPACKFMPSGLQICEAERDTGKDMT